MTKRRMGEGRSSLLVTHAGEGEGGRRRTQGMRKDGRPHAQGRGKDGRPPFEARHGRHSLEARLRRSRLAPIRPPPTAHSAARLLPSPCSTASPPPRPTHATTASPYTAATTVARSAGGGSKEGAEGRSIRWWREQRGG